MASADGIASLVALGFTELEARVYAHLVATGAATGYRIAQETGKPVANTYKAIESLERKGAVLVEDGATRIVTAVEPDRVLDALARHHEGERKRAKAALRKVARSEEDGRTYTVASEEQTLARARTMIAEAEGFALVRGEASLRAAIRGELADAETRGVDVAEMDGEGLTVAIDAAQCLVAPEGVWTRNPRPRPRHLRRPRGGGGPAGGRRPGRRRCGPEKASARPRRPPPPTGRSLSPVASPCL